LTIEKFDHVISRAFAELKDFVDAAGHLCVDGGTLLAMKGIYPHEELARLPAGFHVSEIIALKVPGVDSARHLVIIQKKPGNP
jgi:16S rRNA (guanine527-N7)-methyltransferase